MARQQKTIKEANSDYINYIAEKEYDRAISLMQYHTQLLWQEFGVFVLAETVIIGFLGNALTENKKIVLGENILVFIGAIIGFCICILWWSTFLHNYKNYLLRMAQARRHEKVLGFSLLMEGKKLSDGQKVNIGNEKFSHSLLVHLLRPRNAVLILIMLFSLVFIVLMIVTSPWL